MFGNINWNDTYFGHYFVDFKYFIYQYKDIVRNRPQDNTVIDESSYDKMVCVLSYIKSKKE